MREIAEQAMNKNKSTKKILTKILRMLENTESSQRLRIINTLNVFYNTANHQAFNEAKFKRMIERF